MSDQIAHEHHWIKAHDQTDTGKIGVRMYCDHKYANGTICGRIETRIVRPTTKATP